MRPLLSREEINALLDEPGASMEESPRQLTIELGRQRIALQGLLNLDPGTVIEFNQSLGKPYEIRAKDKLIAYGELVILNGKLVIQITRLVDCSDEEATE